MEKYKCRFCKEEFEFEKVQQFAAHSSNCNCNPNVISKTRAFKISEKLTGRKRINGVLKLEYILNCQKCNKEYVVKITEQAYNKKKYSKFCCRSCANSRIKTEESNLKTSNSLKASEKFLSSQKKRDDYYISIGKSSKYSNRKSICEVCKKEFDYKWSVKTCSKECNNYLHSLSRQRVIKERGTDNFNTKQESFSYGFLNDFKTDSRLEQAAIVYLIDVFKAEKIEKYKNILNFWENNNHRTFNPDFYVKKENEVYIVEVKMKWSNNSTHNYNRTIPYKKEALQKYCDEKGYRMIWLDFDYDLEFYKIYQKLRKQILDK